MKRHYFSTPVGGIPRCVHCGCDEDDAFVGGQECVERAPVKKQKPKFYIVPVFGCVEPETLRGPYKTYHGMRCVARKIHAKQYENDAIFWLRIPEKGCPEMGTFTTAELSTEDVCGSCGSGLTDTNGNCAKCGL
jgi:hypothetical protein